MTIRVLDSLFTGHEGYTHIVIKNKIFNLWNQNREHKYLFILSPPGCGSTLLNVILSSAKSVSVNNPYGTREGQCLPAVKAIMFNHERRWDESLDFDWQFIKKEWCKYWDLGCPVLLEKSPPNMIRAASIEKHFCPAFFILLHRNPYAQCESLMRVRKIGPQDAARLAVEYLSFQQRNAATLQRKITLSYEQLTNNPYETAQVLRSFLPELRDIRYSKRYSVHNHRGEQLGIVNLNQDKISRLTRSQLLQINGVFSQHHEVLNFFGYEIISI